jgi:diguanylate cyclase (GGDEF)-like protein
VPGDDEVTRLRAIIETQRLVSERAHDLDGVMAAIVETTQQLTRADGAAVEMRDDDEMVYKAASGTAASHVGLRVRVDSCLSGSCVMRGETLVCDDAASDPRVDAEACRRIGVRSMVVVPLTATGIDGEPECVGVLKVMSSEPGAFGPDAQATLELMAGFLGTSIRRAEEFEHRAHQATHDNLTGLPNRMLLLDRTALALARSSRVGTPIALLFLDLDGFKAVNDSIGHVGGDIVLATIASRLREHVRGSDTVARLGGDEYVILCEGLDPEAIEKFAARVRDLVTEPIGYQGMPCQVGVSIGIAFGEPGDSAEALLHRADSRMYSQKHRSDSER